ncbi:hypothetical protein MTO96_038849 [Rhipicephalus appendiculatus]
MKCPTRSAKFLAHLLLAVATISSAASTEDEVTDSYYEDYDYSNTPNWDGLVVGDLELGSEEYGDLCTVDGLKTPYGVIPVNCTKSCLRWNGVLSQTLEALPNGTLCIVMTEKEFSDQATYQNFSCRLGLCYGDVCVGSESENCTWCWKTDVPTMDI